MAKYNKKTVSATATPVATHEGGVGYKYAPKFELIALLASGIDNTFYEKESDRSTRLSNLIDEISKTDKTFVAKALVYARSVMGQRSVTHLGAALLAKHLRGDELGTAFYSKRSRNENKGGIVFRLDDMLEIASAYQFKNPETNPAKIAEGKKYKPFSNAIKNGFKLALEAADTYELAKYQAKSRDLSLVDIINLVHPKPRPEMEEVFKKLMSGELKQFNTVEDKNTKAGQDVAAKLKAGEITKEEAAKELTESKEENFAELITNRKIGYLALLRNLRNILNVASNSTLIKNACALLTDEKLIRKSLVFPHQIDLALEIMLSEFGTSKSAPFIKALNDAYELAIPNLTELFKNGTTAVVFDSSGSMSTPIALNNGKPGARGSEGAIAKAGLIAATLAKGIGADIYHFADYCEEIKFNPADSVNTIKKNCLSKQGRVGYGTEFNSIFRTIGNKYDRVFVISDMQGADALPKAAYTNTHIYSIDICGYGTTMFAPGSKLYKLFGYSSDIYELVKRVEIDPNVILTAIEAIEI